MDHEDENGPMSLEALLGGGMKPGADIGPADVNNEGSFRRGYHHCAADLAHLIEHHGPITAEALSTWVENEGMTWRKDRPLNRKIMAPAFPKA
ncbi:hypothetical protein ALO95_200005 [Pseudomonas syringae pv. antirrhini]|uniref:hypothetical protein n=1 Tax=Pseudomonas syringae group genomosp. 3 TaxID=251701 RepID=UPI000EFA5F9B|nr:hypothetical protein [Pseudomonas syringae group genomosp. 3]RMP44320.1 hypothetical protein ALQ23_200119 [Pseudomonas syringae pv. antirrhini]RMW26017.1 hypothetical protein ALO95_200005 [Pseudomonas syringae pv. antirrhini]